MKLECECGYIQKAEGRKEMRKLIRRDGGHLEIFPACCTIYCPNCYAVTRLKEEGTRNPLGVSIDGTFPPEG